MEATVSVDVLPEPVRVIDGKIHLRYRVNNRWVKDERCNLGQVHVIPIPESEVEAADPSGLCDYCFDKPSI